MPVPTCSISGHTFRPVAGETAFRPGVSAWLGSVPIVLTRPDGTTTTITTARDGSYAVTGLSPGTHTLRVAPTDGRRVLYPPGGVLAPALATGMQVTAADFALSTQPTGTPRPVSPPVKPPASPTPAALPPPATPDPNGLRCGSGKAKGVRGLYTVMHPLPVRLDSRHLSPNCRDYRRRWTIAGPAGVNYARPDPRHAANPARYPRPTYDLSTDLAGEVVAIPLPPGEYDVRCEVVEDATGRVVADVRQDVTVLPDARPARYLSANGDDANAGTADAPWRTIGRAAIPLVTCCTVNLLPGWTDSTSRPITIGANAVLRGLPDAAGSRPVLTVDGCDAVDVVGADAVIVGLKVTGKPTAPEMKGSTQVQRSAKATFTSGNCADGATFIDCEAGLLEYAWEIGGGDGVALIDCVQPDGLGIDKWTIGHLSDGTLVVLGGDYRGGTDESCVRFESGGGTGVAMEFARLSTPELNGKADVTARTGKRIVLHALAVVNPGSAQVASSTTDGPGSRGNTIEDVLDLDCLLDNAQYNFKGTTIGRTIDGSHVNPHGDSPHGEVDRTGVSGIVFKGNCTTDRGPFRIKYFDWVMAAASVLSTPHWVTGLKGVAGTLQVALVTPMPVPPTTQPAAAH